MLEGLPTLIYGPGGALKSFMSCYFAVLIASGETENGLRPVKGKVLILDYENDAEDWALRMRALEAGTGLTVGDAVIHRFCARALPDDAEAIQQIISDYRIDSVIVDPLGPACGGDTKDDETILACFAAFRTLKTVEGQALSILCLDHVNKEGLLYGNIYKVNRSRSVWRLRQSQEAGSDTVYLSLKHEKINRAKLMKPVGFRVEFANEGDELSQVVFHRESVSGLPDLADDMPLKERIMAVLGNKVIAPDGTLLVQEIAEELNAESATVRMALNRYGGQLFTKIETGQRTGRWSLASKREAYQ